MDFKKLLKEAIENNTKIIITGRSGWGKSEMIQQVAEELGYELIDFRLSEVLPEDLIGIPKLKDDFYEYVPPKWLYEVVNNPNKQYLLFLDEITQGTPEVLNICYKIFDKVTRVGNYTLNNVAVVGATNYLDESNYLSELPQPLKKRACMLELNHDVQKATNYLINKFDLPNNSELKNILNETINASNPRSTEKALSLILNDCSKELCTPYIGLNYFDTLSAFIKKAVKPQALTNLEEALDDIKNGFILYNGKQFEIADENDLRLVYKLTDEETEIVKKELSTATLKRGINRFLLTEVAIVHPELTGLELEELSKCKSFAPLKYVERMKKTLDVFTRQFESLKTILGVNDKDLLRRICKNSILRIEVMKTYRNDLPWDIILKQFNRGELTPEKIKEFNKELAEERAKGMA